MHLPSAPITTIRCPNKQHKMPWAWPSGSVLHHEHLDTATAFAELFSQVDDPLVLNTTITTTQPPNQFWLEGGAQKLDSRSMCFVTTSILPPSGNLRMLMVLSTNTKTTNSLSSCVYTRTSLNMYNKNPPMSWWHQSEINYSTVAIKHPWYACTGGKKSLEQWMNNYHIDLLHTKIPSFLGEPDTVPPC